MVDKYWFIAVKRMHITFILSFHIPISAFHFCNFEKSSVYNYFSLSESLNSNMILEVIIFIPNFPATVAFLQNIPMCVRFAV